MKLIKLNNGNYYYVPIYNKIINKEIMKYFFRNCVNISKARIVDPIYSDNVLSKNILKIDQIVIEITQDCNLKCKYCIYSEKYYLQRARSKSFMKRNIAESTFNYFYNILKNREKKQLTFSFYGGEPLINLDAIRTIMELAKSKLYNWNIDYAITTNGTLINDEVADMLIKNDFRILVSLDGPQHIHDKKRIYSNGNGSFSEIISNLEFLKNKNPVYYKKRVGFSVVWSRDLPFIDIYNYFSTSPLVKDQNIRLSWVNDIDTSYYENIKIDEKEISKSNKYIYNNIKTKIENKISINNMERNIISDTITQYLKFNSFSSLFGACLFDNRVYIDVEGNMHICHQMNNKFSIGNIHSGYNIVRMKEIVAEYLAVMNKYCSSCDYKYLCQRCFVLFAKNGYFDHDIKYCEEIRSILKIRLERYIKLREIGYNY